MKEVEWETWGRRKQVTEGHEWKEEKGPLCPRGGVTAAAARTL